MDKAFGLNDLRLNGGAGSALNKLLMGIILDGFFLTKGVGCSDGRLRGERRCILHCKKKLGTYTNQDKHENHERANSPMVLNSVSRSYETNNVKPERSRDKEISGANFTVQFTPFLRPRIYTFI